MTQSPDRNPEQLYPPDALSLGHDGHRWRVAQTKSRREKKLAEFLAEQAIAYYLPLIKRKQPSGKRTRFSFVPAFGNYVFVKASDNQRYLAFRSNHVARFIEVRDQERLVRELLQVRTALSAEDRVYPYDYVSQGQRVRIARGPLRDLEGVVQRKKGGYRLVLSVSSILSAVAMDIEAELVEPIPDECQAGLLAARGSRLSGRGDSSRY